MKTKFLQKSKTALSVFFAVLICSCSYAHGVITTGTTLRVESGSYFINQNNLTVNSGGTVHIYGYMTVTGTFTNEAGISGVVIKSDATGTGSLIINTTSSSITAERYLTQGKWHYIAEPVNDTRIFNTAGFLNLTGGANHDQFYWWDEDGEDSGFIGI